MTEDAPTLGRRAPQQRQAAVLDAARSLFIDAGVARTSIEAIAKRAGVAKGTVFLYFPTKEHIVQAIEAEFNARIVERTRAAATSAARHDAVESWCRELVHAYLDELDVHDMLFYSGAAATRESVADNALIDDLEALLSTLDVDEPAVTAAFLVGGITLLTDRAVLADRAPDADELARAAGRLAVSTVLERTPDAGASQAR